MLNLTFATTASIVLRPGASADIPALLRDQDVKRVALITDPGLVAVGIIAPIEQALRAAGLDVIRYDGVRADPTESIVVDCAERMREARIDGVLGVGGGSVMDVAKLTAYLVRSPTDLETIYGIGLARGPRLPLILVPTTAGTGSEVTPISILTTSGSEKRGVVSARLLPDVAVLDPTLTLNLPTRTTAETGIDAMVHAIEAYTSKRLKNPISDSLAHRALSLLATNLPLVMRDGTDASARGAMLLGSCLAGMAFANAPVAGVHALAYPLGGRHHVSHGMSNALMMVPVLRFNCSAAAPLYQELADAIGAAEPTAEGFISAVQQLIVTTGIPTTLREVGVTRDDLPRLAADAMRQTRLLVNNPVEITEKDALSLYDQAF
jgi:alcohol dehydrogenase class IV